MGRWAFGIEGMSDVDGAQLSVIGAFDGQINLRKSLGSRIVYAYHMSIGSEAEVAFNSIGLHFPREVKCGEGIFRRISRCATMGDDGYF